MDYVTLDSLGDTSRDGNAIQIRHAQTPTLRNVVIRNSEQYDVLTWVGGARNFANVRAVVSVNGDAGKLDALMPNFGTGTRYRLLRDVYIDRDYKLTIGQGVNVEFLHFDCHIHVNGTLLARGTVGEPIRFQGRANRVYNGNSTHGGSIYFNNGGGASVLEHVLLDSLGDASRGGSTIRINYPQTPALRNVVVRNSEQYDVLTWVGGARNFADVRAVVSVNGSAGKSDALMPRLGPNTRYRLLNDVYVDKDYKLTIESGVTVEFLHFDCHLHINGALLAQGTPNEPIRFQGRANRAYNGNSTHGGGIYINTGGGTSTLENVTIDSLGDASRGGNALRVNYPQTPALRNVVIRNSEQYDVLTWVGGARNFANVRAVVSVNGSAGKLDALMPKLSSDSRYQLLSDVYIDKDHKLIIDHGVTVEFLHFDCHIHVNGTLLARGTVGEPIRFQGRANRVYNGNSTHGGSIYFNNGGGASVMEHVNIDSLGDASRGGRAVVVNANCTLKYLTVSNSEQIGVDIGGNTISPVIQNITFLNNPTPLRAYPGSCSGLANIPNIPILLQSAGLTANTSWPYPGQNSFYQLTGQAQVPQAYQLTIGAGTVVDFGIQGQLVVNGSLRAIGTENAPIRFTRLATEGAFTGRFDLTSTSTNSVLSFVNIDKLGTNSRAALDIATPNFSLANVTISQAANRGLELRSVENAVISGSTFFGNKTGVYVNSGRPTFANCSIYGNTDFGINNGSGVVADTVDARNCYWGVESGPLHPTLNPTGKGNAVSNKVKFNPWRQKPQNGQLIDMGISVLVAPITDCNYTAPANVTVRIRNYGNTGQTNIPIAYRINNGSIVTETISTTALSPGESLDYTFTQKANLSAIGSYTVLAYTVFPVDTFRLNDTLRATFRHLAGVVAPANLLPASNTVDLAIPVKLSWAAVPGALAYDLYVWKSDAPVPAKPLVADLSQISYTLSGSSFTYGTPYSWKVIAKQISCRAESAVAVFTTRRQADLIVETITAPVTGTSENDFSVSWSIKNQGNGATLEKNWLDAVYLCDQPVLNAGSDNFHISSRPNLSALGVGQSYQSGTLTFRLPQGIQGKYYLIVQTNPARTVPEVQTGNNQLASQPITISLAPPPDLQVTNLVVAPLNAFSDDSVTVTFTVKNVGTGPTTTANWTDQVFLTQNQTVDVATDRLLYTHRRLQALSVNGEYIVTTKVRVPNRINGTYYLHVVTDRLNQVFEYNKEDNNSRVSPAMTIIQRPTPNLLVQGLTILADTIAARQSLTIQWTTTNDGAVATSTGWQEAIYMSADTIFNETTDRQLTRRSRTDQLQSLSSSSVQQTVTLPASTTEGTYYFFVKTDAADQIYESLGEQDNVSARSKAVRMEIPDLRPMQLTAPTSAISEQTVAVQWRVRNDSPAGIFGTNWKDKLYLSTNNTFEAATDRLLTTVVVNQLLVAGGEYSKQISATLPTGVAGNYFLLLVSDADSSVSEKVETNNLRTAPIAITLAPASDLQVLDVAGPLADTLGTPMQLQYVVRNSGPGTADNKTWRDSVFLSPTSTLNRAALFYLGHTVQRRSLTNGQSFTQSATFTLPTSLNGGRYFVVVKANADSTLFENNAYANNTTIAATSVNLVVPPSIDLAVTGGTVTTTPLIAGQPAAVRWTVRNNSPQATVVPNWTDAVYLSTNPVLDASDRLLATFPVTGPLAAMATYTNAQTISLPPDVAGTTYLLVVTDKDNRHVDTQRANNTLAVSNGADNGQPVSVMIPPPADLVPTGLTGPAEGVVSQPINVSFTVRNNGGGSTPSSTWTDELYLSTDQTLRSDIRIGTFARNGTLPAGDEYTITRQVFLPDNVSGNYVLLLKTDAGNTVFERGNEDNNLAFANLTVVAQPPSDLVVTDISVPAGEQFAGSNGTIRWRLTNVGTNATNGFLREAVYLSKDTLVDATDVLLGVVDKTTFLPARASEERTLTRPLTALAPGDYFVIVRTDVQNNIVESNESNNQVVSSQPVRIAVKELVLNKLTTDSIATDAPVYYRLEVPANLVDETLLITLQGDSTRSVMNRLFVRKDSLPSANQFTYSAAVPFKANQQLLIPGLRAGTYYLMAIGADTTRNRLPIQLLAKIVPFGIETIDAREGGNTGLVTVKISGARFESSTRFSLRKAAGQVTARRVQLINQTLAYVTFDLQNQPLGLYDVLVERPGSQTVVLPNGFTVKQGPTNTQAANGNGGPAYGTGFVCSITNDGLDQQLAADFVTPAGIRFNTIGSFTIQYKNEGSVDIPAPTRFLISLNEGVSVTLAADKLDENKTDLILLCEEENGPRGILRPGASGFFKIYTISKNRGVTSIDLLLIE
ncbi:CARDB domain-containing protein [Spirosoma sordidisoli]|uniref:CARDB domain-containing protein n=1 Tax=Spirosoma sordidisoli TaxID=2502893 RepID=UPI0013EB7DD3|nr:CARDB domain-containing protein [Spirosoma sordidisoli]